MIVYHGTNCDIDEIDLNIGSRFKDFGKGFYVTPDIDTAKRMAKKKKDLYGGEAVLITYDFDDSILQSNILKTLQFPEKATSKWIKFIDANRSRYSEIPPHDFDIIKGPIADDGVALQLERLRAHVELAESIAIDLQDKYLDQQIYFGTERALQYLRKESVCKII